MLIDERCAPLRLEDERDLSANTESRDSWYLCHEPRSLVTCS